MVLELRRLGHDVVTVWERGLANIGTPDPTVLATAAAEGRAVLTENRVDFIRLHRADPLHAGVIVCSKDNNVPAYAARVHAALSAGPDLSGQLVRVNRPSVQHPPPPPPP